jgi:thioredoxin-like negative regulator of GroEL
MQKVFKSDLINTKKNGVYVFHSFRCWTCRDHIEELKKHIGHFYTFDYDTDVDFCESLGILMTPTTVVYKNDIEICHFQGMLFETQIDKLLGFL